MNLVYTISTHFVAENGDFDLPKTNKIRELARELHLPVDQKILFEDLSSGTGSTVTATATGASAVSSNYDLARMFEPKDATEALRHYCNAFGPVHLPDDTTTVTRSSLSSAAASSSSESENISTTGKPKLN